MKKTILSLTLALIISVFTSCTPHNTESKDTSDTASTPVTTVGETTQSTSEEKVYFEITESGGTYSYKLFNLDGSLAEEMEGFSLPPVIEVTESLLISIKNESEHYFYDLEAKKFSESFEKVFDTHGKLLITEGEKSVVVRDIFNSDGLFKKFSRFSASVASDAPFVTAEFIEDGGAVEVVYKNENGIEYSECFNISNGSKFVMLYGWLEDLIILPTSEKESLQQYLYGYMGSCDPNTGFPYTHTVKGILKMNGKDYYYCKSTCTVELEDGTESIAPAGEFLLSHDKTERYDCRNTDGDLKVFTENDLH